MLAPKESLVKILVKHNNTNNVIHCSNKRARTQSARAPLLFPSPLLLLFCLTKILTDKLNPNLDQTLDQNLDQTLGQIWTKTGNFRAGISPGGVKQN